jgi:membrane fusion protein (multidrug efflux system)
MKKVVLLASTALFVILSACSHEEAPEEKFDFKVTSVAQQDTTTTKDYVCVIHAIQHIELRTLEKGYLNGIFAQEGESVKKGQLLFRILPAVYSAEKEIAQAEAEYAKVQYQNTKRLADSNIVSQNQLLLSKAELEKANANLNLAKTHLGFTDIVAPFDGIMDRYHARLGSLMDEGDLLSSLSDISQFWAYFNVPEAAYLDFFKAVAESDSTFKVQFRMANQEMFDYSGIVNTVEADFNSETGNIALRATFPNPQKLIRHGETGNIVITEPLKNVLIIPQKATFEILEKTYIFVVDKNNVVHQKEVQIAGELPDLFIVKSGVKAGDKILYEGIRKVRDNEKIDFDYIAPQKLFKQLQVDAE